MADLATTALERKLLNMNVSSIWMAPIGVLGLSLCGLGVPGTGPDLAAARAVVGGTVTCYVCKDTCDDGLEPCEEAKPCESRSAGGDPEVFWCTSVVGTYSAVCEDVGESGITTECDPGSEPTHCAEYFANVCAGPPAAPSCTGSFDTCGTKYTCTLQGDLCPQGGGS